MFGLTKEEEGILKKLNSPRKIQDFVNNLSMNFEPDGDSCRSPRMVLKTNNAHCIEAALLASLTLRIHGERGLIVDMEANSKDFDHVVAVFQKNKKWGAISKSNHAVLRYREPVYRDVRELVMSYFHEYHDNGIKTLRKFSLPVDMSRFDKLNWVTREDDLWEIPEYLTEIKHFNILDRKQIRSLRELDEIEKKAMKVVEWEIN
jgi:hypothetical protein